MNRREVLKNSAGVALVAMLPKGLTAAASEMPAADAGAFALDQVQAEHLWQDATERVAVFPRDLARDLAFNSVGWFTWSLQQMEQSQPAARIVTAIQQFACFAYGDGDPANWDLRLYVEDGEMRVGISRPIPMATVEI